MGREFNVVLFNDNFEPSVDGVVKTVYNYAKQFAIFDKVSVVCPKYRGCKNNYDFPVYRVASIQINETMSSGIIAPNKKIKKAINEQKAEIYHTHSPFVIGHLALKLAKKNKVPLVATFHSKYKDDFLQITKSKLITKCLMNYIMRFYNKCDAIWTCSKDTAKTLRSYGYKGPITIMLNGTDFVYPDNIEEIKNKIKKIYNINESKKNILFVGQMIWQKNIRLILDVAKVLVEKDKDYHFYFVGTGIYEKAIKEYASKLKLNDFTSFLGVIKDHQILKGLYSICDLFFFPSLYDNAPLVIREAAVMNTPSLAAKGATCAEVITDGVNGYLADSTIEAMTKRIQDIFIDKKNIQECGKQASKTIPIKWEDIIVEVKKEYKKVIDNYNLIK